MAAESEQASKWLDELSRLAGNDLERRRTSSEQAKSQVTKLELARDVSYNLR